MKHAVDFSIQNLLFLQDDKVQGPMTQVLFAQKLADHISITCRYLVRISFSNTRINIPLNTADSDDAETLILADGFTDELRLYFAVRIGKAGILIAEAHELDRQTGMILEYQSAILLEKLSKEDIYNIADYIFKHPHVLDIPYMSP